MDSSAFESVIAGQAYKDFGAEELERDWQTALRSSDTGCFVISSHPGENAPTSLRSFDAPAPHEPLTWDIDPSGFALIGADALRESIREIVKSIEVEISRFGMSPTVAQHENAIETDTQLTKARIRHHAKTRINSQRRYRRLLREELKKVEIKPAPISARTELPLNGDFVPSDALLQIWINALNAIMREAEEESQSEFVSLQKDKQNLRKEFYSRFRSTLMQFAVAESYRNSIYRLSIDGRFVYPFSSAIFSEFLIDPNEGTNFFKMLISELTDWLHTNGEITSSWGTLKLDAAGDFILHLRRRKKFKTSGFKATNFTINE